MKRNLHASFTSLFYIMDSMRNQEIFRCYTLFKTSLAVDETLFVVKQKKYSIIDIYGKS
jgi:hypothetical protein